MSAVVIIPARLASSRLPGKVLLSETGKPLIRHVWEAAKRASAISRVVVATDDVTVLDTVLGFGGEAVLTGTQHQNGTSRLAEAAARLELSPEDIVVNVQGDEPELEPGSIDAAVDALVTSEQNNRDRGGCAVGTIAVPFAPGQDPRDPAMVKVVRALDGSALYFSRSLIPHDRDGTPDSAGGLLRHVGLYVYRRAFLERYVSLPQTPAERLEQLEQLRVLEHGYRIAVAVREHAAIGIDTPGQYAAFVARQAGLPR